MTTDRQRLMWLLEEQGIEPALVRVVVNGFTDADCTRILNLELARAAAAVPASERD